jgi:hypothetical protein
MTYGDVRGRGALFPSSREHVRGKWQNLTLSNRCASPPLLSTLFRLFFAFNNKSTAAKSLVVCASILVAAMHEIVTLQFGTQSNYLGTHFWNTQARKNFNNPLYADTLCPPMLYTLCCKSTVEVLWRNFAFDAQATPHSCTMHCSHSFA